MLESIGTRIKQLRKKLKLTQTEFGKRLNVSIDVIANIEHGRLARPEQKEPLFRLMCNEFNVRYEWLMTGEGEMFDESQEDFFDKISKRYGLGKFAQKILEFYCMLEDEEKKRIEDFIYQTSKCALEDNIQKARSNVLEAILNKKKQTDIYDAAINAFEEAFPYVDNSIDNSIGAGIDQADNNIAADIKKTIQQGETAISPANTRKK